MLEAVSRLRPELLDFALSAYGASSFLWTGDTILHSSEGVQQGDPLGPLFFCLTLDSPLKSLLSEYVTGYLDDVGVGDTVPRLIDQVRSFEVAAASVGLTLNHSKCEIVGLDESQRAAWEASGLNFQVRSAAEATFLGAPLSLSATSSSLRECRLQLLNGKSRLLQMQAHEAFFLLCSSVGVPKLQFLLRTAPCCFSEEVEPLDTELRSMLQSIANIQLSSEAWRQASLPV